MRRPGAAPRGSGAESPLPASHGSDLEVLTLQLQGVQRNYESMSRLMQAKQAELDALQAKASTHDVAEAGLGTQLQDALARAEAAEAQLASLHALPERVASLQAEINKLRFEANLAEGRSAAMKEKLDKLTGQAEDPDHISQKAQRELVAAAQREDELRSELLKSQGFCQILSEHLMARGAEVARLSSALAASQRTASEAEQRSALLSGKLATRDEEGAVLRQELRSTRGALEREKTARAADAVSLAAARGSLSVVEGQMQTLKRTLTLEQETLRSAETTLTCVGVACACSRACLSQGLFAGSRRVCSQAATGFFCWQLQGLFLYAAGLAFSKVGMQGLRSCLALQQTCASAVSCR